MYINTSSDYYKLFNCFIQKEWEQAYVSFFEVDNLISTFKIECQYLAKKINPYYDRFFIECEDLICFDLRGNKILNLHTLFNQYSVIRNVKLENEKVFISLNKKNEEPRVEVIQFSCKEIRIFEQHRKEIKLQQLLDICSDYSDEDNERLKWR